MLVRLCLILVGTLFLAAPAVHADQQHHSSRNSAEIAKKLVDDGKIKFERGDIQGAIANLHEALKAKPDYSRAYFNLSVIYCNLGDLDKEIYNLTKAIQYDPSDTDAITQRGVAQAQTGRVEAVKQAIVDLQRSLKMRPEQARAYWGLGLAKESLESYPEAVNLYTRAIQLDPKFVAAFHDRGMAHLLISSFSDSDVAVRKHNELAVSDFTQAIGLQPDHATAYNIRGLTRWHLGDKQGGLQDLQKSLVLYRQQNLTDEHQLATEMINELKKVLNSPSNSSSSFSHR